MFQIMSFTWWIWLFHLGRIEWNRLGQKSICTFLVPGEQCRVSQLLRIWQHEQCCRGGGLETRVIGVNSGPARARLSSRRSRRILGMAGMWYLGRGM
jgi:hypothetical protein